MPLELAIAGGHLQRPLQLHERRPQIAQRLEGLLTDAFGQPPFVVSRPYSLFNQIYFGGPAFDHVAAPERQARLLQLEAALKSLDKDGHEKDLALRDQEKDLARLGEELERVAPIDVLLELVGAPLLERAQHGSG